MTALAGSTAGIGGTSTSAAPMRLRARQPGVATLSSVVARMLRVRPVEVTRESPVGREPTRLEPVGADPERPVPVVPLASEPGPVGLESGAIAVAAVTGGGSIGSAARGAPAIRPQTVQ